MKTNNRIASAVEWNNMEHNIGDSTPTIARLKLLYIFIVTILCMKEAYRTGGAIFSTFICSVGVMLMILLAFSFLEIVSDFKKCIRIKYHEILLSTMNFVHVLIEVCSFRTLLSPLCHVLFTLFLIFGICRLSYTFPKMLMKLNDFCQKAFENLSKWFWKTTSDFKWIIMTSNDFKWLKMTPNDFKWLQMTPNEFK